MIVQSSYDLHGHQRCFPDTCLIILCCSVDQTAGPRSLPLIAFRLQRRIAASLCGGTAPCATMGTPIITQSSVILYFPSAARAGAVGNDHHVRRPVHVGMMIHAPRNEGRCPDHTESEKTLFHSLSSGWIPVRSATGQVNLISILKRCMGSKTSGSSCATTGSRTASSNPMTTSSPSAATHGTTSSTARGKSCPSGCGNGPMGEDQCRLVLVNIVIDSLYFTFKGEGGFVRFRYCGA